MAEEKTEETTEETLVETPPRGAETQAAAEPPDINKQYQVGDKVSGSVPPCGGSWKYDSAKDELELVEQPTQKD